MSPTHALLWYGQSVDATHSLVRELIEAHHIAPIDTTELAGGELAIEAVRALRRFATTSPHTSPYKLILITETDRLSPVVANSLLKLIEEPPSYCLIRLSATQLDRVLPTIRSRCQLVPIGGTPVTTEAPSVQDLRQLPIADRFERAKELADDPALASIVTQWLSELRAELLRGDDRLASIARALELEDRLRSTINRRLALEGFLYSLDPIP